MFRRTRACSAGVSARGVLAAAVACTGEPADGGSSTATKPATQPRTGVAAAAPQYVTSTDSMANPERGFYRDQGRCDRDDFQVATLRDYQNRDKITLVMCDFYTIRSRGVFLVSGVNATIRPCPAHCCPYGNHRRSKRVTGRH